MRIESKLLLLVMWVSLLSQPLLVRASGPQYRESNLDFVSSLTTRLNVADTRATELEAQVDEINTQQNTRNIQIAKASPKTAKPVSASASTGPQQADGVYTRVPERLRHKQRAVDANPEELGRIKVKFPSLREDINKTRKNLLGHELTHVPQSGGRNTGSPGLVEIESAITEIETKLANLTAEIEAAEKALSK